MSDLNLTVNSRKVMSEVRCRLAQHRGRNIQPSVHDTAERRMIFIYEYICTYACIWGLLHGDDRCVFTLFRQQQKDSAFVVYLLLLNVSIKGT